MAILLLLPRSLVCGFVSPAARFFATVDCVELGDTDRLRSNAEIRKKADTERPTEFGAPKLNFVLNALDWKF